MLRDLSLQECKKARNKEECVTSEKVSSVNIVLHMSESTESLNFII